MSKKAKRIRNIIIFTVLFIILAVSLILYSMFHGKLAQNPAGTIGNLSGNLNNRGLFCEQGGVVYFSNAYDGGTLYSMNIDESNVKKISSSQVEYINAGGKYLYFYQMGGGGTGLGFIGRSVGLYRIKSSGGNAICLLREPCSSIVLIDNTLYYQYFRGQSDISIWQIDTNGANKKRALDRIISPVCAKDSVIYYNNINGDHNFYSYDTRTHLTSNLWDGDAWNPVILGEYIYFMDVSSDYRICRRPLYPQGADDGVEVLTNDRADTFNVYGDFVYYQKNSQTEPELRRMRTDGSSNELVASGIFQNINVTSAYVYFSPYGVAYPVYRTPVYGPVNVTEFLAAKDAVPKK